MKTVEVEALTVVNVGKGHYMPGQTFHVAPGLSKELKQAGLVKIVGESDVPKEARADDGQYAEEPGTDIVTSLTRTKVAAGLDIEEAVATVSEDQAEADNQDIEDSETAKDVEETGLKPDQKTIDMEKDKAKTAPKTDTGTKDDKSKVETKENKEASGEATK